MKRLLVFWLLFLPSLLFAGLNDDFKEGMRLYDQGDFQASADKLQSIIDQGYGSASLYYNAGCAYYKAGHLGDAIADFRRAERISPDDEDIRTNLAFVKQFCVDKVDPSLVDPFSDRLETTLAKLHPNYYFTISFAAFALLFAFLALKRLGVLRKVGNWPAVVLVVLTLLSAAAMGWVLKDNYVADEGVITVAKTDILSGPGTDFELQFEGHEGLTFTILEQKQDYYLGLFANKLKGWVKTSAVEKI